MSEKAKIAALLYLLLREKLLTEQDAKDVLSIGTLTELLLSKGVITQDQLQGAEAAVQVVLDGLLQFQRNEVSWEKLDEILKSVKHVVPRLAQKVLDELKKD